LSKQLYLDYKKRQLIPVLVEARKLKASTFQAFDNTIKEHFYVQYSEELFKKYSQTDKSSKVLIVDNFHHLTRNKKALIRALDFASNIFDFIILISDDIFEITEIAIGGEDTNSLLSFRHCSIMEFGHLLRKKLTEKWHWLGLDYSTDEYIIENKIIATENLLDTIIGNNLIPSYPIFILTILQTIEAERLHGTVYGSFGSLYEILIISAISGFSKKIPMDTKMTFLSRIAYYLFVNNQREIDMDQFGKIADDYFDKYKVKFIIDKFVDDAVEGHIFKKLNGVYRFKYPYYFYYFVAKYFQENLGNENEKKALRAKIDAITTKLYNEDYANIIIFLVYLTKDSHIIMIMLKNAESIYNEYKPCDIEKDVKFISGLQKEEPELVLVDRDPKDSRESLLQSLDEAEAKDNIFDNNELSEIEQQQTDDILQVNVSFKTIQILGQILRNFPGSLPGDIKIKLTKESYFLGLRTFKALMTIFERNIKEFRELITEYLREQKKVKEDEVVNRTDQFIFYLSLFLSIGIIKKISRSVGSEHLGEIYKAVLQECPQKSVSLIDISIKLDNFFDIPVPQIERLYKELKGNLFASTLLRFLVLYHLNIFKVPFHIKQSLKDKLNISEKQRKHLAGHPARKK